MMKKQIFLTNDMKGNYLGEVLPVMCAGTFDYTQSLLVIYLDPIFPQ